MQATWTKAELNLLTIPWNSKQLSPVEKNSFLHEYKSHGGKLS